MYAMNFTRVGANIQKALSHSNMTQQSLADRLGISKQVMSKIIKGSKAINVAELSGIAAILSITADELLTLDGSAIKREPNPAFMGMVKDEKTKAKVDLLRTAIDQIYLLEELRDA